MSTEPDRGPHGTPPPASVPPDIVVGSLHGEVFEANPSPAWRELRAIAPFFHDTVDDVRVLSRHDDVVWAFTQAPGLSNRVYGRTVGKVFGESMLQMDGFEHVQRRKIVAPQMMGGRLAKYSDLIETVSGEIADDATRSGDFDLVSAVSARLPGTVISTLLGLPVADHKRFFDWYNAMMAGLWKDAELRRRGHVAHLEFQDYLRPIIAERSERPGDDLISRLLTAQVDGEKLDSDDLGSFISLLLTAGGETTDKAIANLWWLLMTHPDEYTACRNDPDRLELVFSETMRLFPSLLYLGRETTEPLRRRDVEIPVGSVVRLAVGSANRDERVFTDPDRFWPDRPDLHRGRELRSAQLGQDGEAGHLAFGAGAHFCIGYELARLETIAVSRALLKRLGPSPQLISTASPKAQPPAWTLETLVIRPS